jgi:hypothetical protein
MSTVQPFKKGDRVVFSAEAKRLSFDGRPAFSKPDRIGTVIGSCGLSTEIIRIRWDHKSASERWNHAFLSLATPPVESKAIFGERPDRSEVKTSQRVAKPKGKLNV